MQNHTLMAQPLNVKDMVTTGTPRPIAEDVLLSTGSLSVFGVFSVSARRLVSLSQGGDFDDPMGMLANWTTESPARR